MVLTTPRERRGKPKKAVGLQLGTMNPSAYIETSVVSYLTARPSRDVVVAAYQEVTREWWRSVRARFTVFVSELVVAEVGAGDPGAARARLKVLEGIPRLRATEDSEMLARNLVALGAVPREAGDDAAHIAIAVTNGIDYLVTWNLRHIANATMRSRIEEVCRRSGYVPAVICTPNEILEITP